MGILNNDDVMDDNGDADGYIYIDANTSGRPVSVQQSGHRSPKPTRTKRGLCLSEHRRRYNFLLLWMKFDTL
jgi:hypothetical protein